MLPPPPPRIPKEKSRDKKNQNHIKKYKWPTLLRTCDTDCNAEPQNTPSACLRDGITACRSTPHDQEKPSRMKKTSLTWRCLLPLLLRWATPGCRWVSPTAHLWRCSCCRVRPTRGKCQDRRTCSPRCWWRREEQRYRGHTSQGQPWSEQHLQGNIYI